MGAIAKLCRDRRPNATVAIIKVFLDGAEYLLQGPVILPLGNRSFGRSRSGSRGPISEENLGGCRAEDHARNLEARHFTEPQQYPPKKMSFFRLATQSLSRSTFTAARTPSRYVPRARYSTPAGLSKDTIQARVFDVLKGFEKVDKSKVGPLLFHFRCRYSLPAFSSHPPRPSQMT